VKGDWWGGCFVRAQERARERIMEEVGRFARKAIKTRMSKKKVKSRELSQEEQRGHEGEERRSLVLDTVLV